jgi:hypothetical protein
MNNKHLMLLVNGMMTELNALHGVPNRMEIIASHAIDTGVFLEELLMEELKHVKTFNIHVFNADEQSTENFDGYSNVERIIVEVLEAVMDSIATKLSVVLKASAKMIEDLLDISSDKYNKSLEVVDMSQVGMISNAAIKEIITDLVKEERVNLEKIPGFLPRIYPQCPKGQFYIDIYDGSDVEPVAGKAKEFELIFRKLNETIKDDEQLDDDRLHQRP